MLRAMEEQDISLLSEKLQDLSSEDQKWFHPHPYTEDALQKLLTEKGNYFFVFEHQGKLAGYSLLRTFNKYPIPTYGGVIWEQYRGKGLGTELLVETLLQAKKLGFSKVKLRVYEENKTAFELYKHHGFKLLEQEDGQWWMQKTLD